ncbi:restriction endonuclease [Actinoplanes sp. NPDC089786]|uniref:restriction endonuclease n=1 Tax=Actinoplanes sp. NPDC089786 TaxID=3155185 RepID=UPI003447D95F
MHNNDLRELLLSAQHNPRPAERGRHLETITAALFRREHFRVQLNPGSASPRQTDLIAIKVGDIYLVECKWRSDKANIDDVDSLRSRLRRVDTHAVGILLSYEGFTEPVLTEVLANRSQAILLISGRELEQVASGFRSLSDLLWRKRQALITDGEVLLDEPTLKNQKRLVQLPRTEYEVLWSDSSRTQLVECAGRFGQFVFTHDLPDIDWVIASGVGVTLDISPPVHDAEGVENLLRTAADLGWVTPEARWSIQQARRNWHGWGAHEFVAELQNWEYRAKTEKAHDSEEFLYTDVCDGGFYTIAATISTHHSRQVRSVNISFQFQGHPLDTRPLLELCNTIGVHENLYLRPRESESVTILQMQRKDIRADSILGLVTKPESDPRFDFSHWVIGLIVKNSFFAGQEAPPAETQRQLRILEDTELLVCNLSEHHPLDSKKYDYYFQRFEYAQTSDGPVISISANWREFEEATSSSDESRPNVLEKS